jgi:hypothetical protein
MANSIGLRLHVDAPEPFVGDDVADDLVEQVRSSLFRLGDTRFNQVKHSGCFLDYTVWVSYQTNFQRDVVIQVFEAAGHEVFDHPLDRLRK